ncbi:MAG: cobalamin-dependent protein, partial [Balneolaceae bacterium]|nr:cobalamin-dependent protein [Balneolaceae bacterium]
MSDSSTIKEESKKADSLTNGQEVAEKYQPVNKVRFITAASLFDGHDASINIMRRILQATGAEVIHLGHNRSVHEIVQCAIQEDAQGIAISSYQGGHNEYFKYMIDLLEENNASQIHVFGGGGGVISDEEIKDLHDYGVTRIFSVEDGSKMGLQGMINFMMEACDFDPSKEADIDPQELSKGDVNTISRTITALENRHDDIALFNGTDIVLNGDQHIQKPEKNIPVLGITGTGGAGKSSLTDEIVRRFLSEFEDLTIGVISIDPSKIRTGGALLGDRIRMNSIDTPRVFMRSLATRASNKSISDAVKGVIEVYKAAGFDLVIVETSGIGQSGTEIVDVCDIPVYVMTHEYGAATQLEKINMLDVAEIVVLNKFDKKGSLDALRDIRKQMQRNRGDWHIKPDKMPVYPTIAAQFNDEGIHRLFAKVLELVNERYPLGWKPELYTNSEPAEDLQTQAIIPGRRKRYLSEISETIEGYHQWAGEQVEIASKLDQVRGTLNQIKNWNPDDEEKLLSRLYEMEDHWMNQLDSL